MQPDKRQQIKDIFNSALEYSGEEQERYLIDACGADQDLRREVDILLHSYQSAFLESPLYKLDSANIQIGQKINHYKILEELGRGGMGEVFLAEDTRLYRKVAIKFLKYGNEKSEMHLKREARAAALLNHSNICTIFEIGENNSRSFIVMEHIEGETLDKLIRQKNLSIKKSVAIALAIADALSEAHSRGVIHRDIKPSNVIVTPKGQVKVLDFGLAKKTIFSENESEHSLFSNTGVVAGTVSYMSPEQARGKAIDERSDIWSLGVVLYEMLTGNLPFSGESKSDVIASILTKDFPKISETGNQFTVKFNQIIEISLQKDRNERFSTAEDFHSELALLQTKFNSEPTDEINRDVSTLPIRTFESVQPSDFVGNDTIKNQGSTDSELIQATKESSFYRIMKTVRPYRLAVLLLIGAIAASLVGWRMYQIYSKDNRPFSESSRGNLQITNLFSVKRKPNGTITDLSFSPDGKLISFLLTGYNSNDLYIKQVDQGEPIKLTDGKLLNQTPVWSPDGQRLAFVSNREGKNAIWSISYLGGTPKLETDLELNRLTYQLRKWSKDGKQIFFENAGKLKILELDSAKISEIKLPEVEISGSFSISNDEKMIAYIVTETTKEQIWTQSLETGEANALPNNDFHNWSPVFFPDNQKIAFSSNQNGNFQIYVSDLFGSEQTQITFGESNASSPVISPDGKKIVFLSEVDEANVFSLDLKSGNETQQTANTKLQIFPDTSPDDAKMVFQMLDDPAKLFSSPLKIKNLEFENQTDQVVQFGGFPVWSPKGDSIAFIKQTGMQNQIWKIDVANQKEKQITSDVISGEGFKMSPYNLLSIPFSWSPDGKQIVYPSKKSGFSNLMRIDENGGNNQILTNNNDPKTRVSSPLWSPAGNQIAYIQRTQINPNQVQFSVSVLSNEQNKNIFQTNSLVRLLGWTENGADVLVALDKTESIELLQISVVKDVRSRTLLSAAGANIHCFSLSRDGRRVAFSARRNEIDNLFVYSINGSVKQVTQNFDNARYFSGLTWSNDNNKLFYSKQSGGLQISMISDSK